MGFLTCLSRAVARIVRFTAATSGLLILTLLYSIGSRATAADLTVTSGDTLNITGAATSVLPTTAASATVLPTTAPSTSVLHDDSSGRAAESGWLSGLHISGFLSQTFGMW